MKEQSLYILLVYIREQTSPLQKKSEQVTHDFHECKISDFKKYKKWRSVTSLKKNNNSEDSTEMKLQWPCINYQKNDEENPAATRLLKALFHSMKRKTEMISRPQTYGTILNFS